MPVAADSPAITSKSRFLHNVVWGWIGVAVNLVIGLVLSPIIIARLGVAKYGLWVLLFTAVEYFRMLDFGFRAAVVNACARCATREDWQGVNRAAATAVVYFLIAGVIAVAGATLFRDVLLNALNVPAGDRGLGRQLLLLISLAVAVRLLVSPLTAVLEGFQRFDLANHAYIAALVFRSVASLTLLLLGFGLLEMAYVYLLAQLIEGVWTVTYVRRVTPAFSLAPSLIDRDTFGGLFRFGRHSAVLAAANLVSIQAPATVLGLLRGPVDVAFFSFPFRLLMYSAEGLAKVADVTMSVTSGLDETRRAERVWTLAVTVNRTCLMLFMPIAIFLGVYGAPLLSVWTPEIAADSAPLLPILLLMFTLAVAGQYNAGAVVIGQGRHGAYAWAVVGEVLAAIVGMVWLVPVYGVIGAAWVVSLTYVSVRGLFLAILICRQNDFPLFTYLGAIYARPLLLAIPVGAVMWGLRSSVLPGANWPQLVAAAAFGAGAYLGAAWFVVLDRGVRSVVAGQARRLLMR